MHKAVGRTVIFEIGSSSCKIGYSSDETPTEIPSVIGCLDDQVYSTKNKPVTIIR